MRKALKTLLLFFLGTGVYNHLYAQSFSCYTPTTTARTLTFDAESLRQMSIDVCLRIYVHVIRRSNGTGGPTVSEVNQSLAILDQHFNPHDIHFIWNGLIEYMDDDDYYNAPGTNVFDRFSHEDGIDIYLFDDDASATGGATLGPGVSSAFFVSGTVDLDGSWPLSRTGVLSHEMGHVLYLWHTHHGSLKEPQGSCPEFADGSNSSICGDFVTDTPADPGFIVLGGAPPAVNHPSCTWNYSGSDATGTFDPDETLLMSYSHPGCTDKFTTEQGQVMRNAVTALPHLIDATIDCEENNCPLNVIVTQDVGNGSEDNKDAKHTISANNTISNGGVARYRAGRRVTLNPGFRAMAGSFCVASAQFWCSETVINPYRRLDSGAQDEEVIKEEEQSMELLVYPNPSDGFFHLQYDFKESSIYEVNVISCTGEIVFSDNLVSTDPVVDIKGVSDGLYFLNVTEDGVLVQFTEILVNSR